MSLILDGTSGLSDVDGSAATPAIRGSDANTGVFFGTDIVGVSTGGSERMRVDASGNVGIGVVPSAWSSQARAIQTGIYAGFYQNASGLTAVSFNSFQNTSNIDTYRVSANPATKYELGGTHAWFTAPSGTAGDAISFTQAMTLDSSGNLLVGTTSQTRSGDRMSVVGPNAQVVTFANGTNASGRSTIASILGSNGNNTSTYHLWGNTDGVGNWFLYGNGTSTFSSDLRLKKNIETTRDGYLEDVAKLRVVKYNWRNDEDGKPKELGLIAQEVEQVFPGLVQNDAEKISEDDETRYKSIKQSVLPFILLKAIQEQQAIITALTARVEALEGAQA